jgi:hypothetical protein
MLQQNGISYLFFDANFMQVQVSTSFAAIKTKNKKSKQSINGNV